MIYKTFPQLVDLIVAKLGLNNRMSETIQKVKTFARQNSKQEDIHGFPHVMRVYTTCMELANLFDVNLDILKISALLHDTGRVREDTENRNHAELSAEMTKSFLNSTNLGLSKLAEERIIHCIRSHSFSNGVFPETIEAKILSDADKLDALGSIGLYRTIGFTIKNGGGLAQVIDHLENKILKLKDLLYLDETKQMAQEKHRFILEFYQKLEANLGSR
ncbi:MAG: HD domain-containing protein [Promethearchaeia archaeon]